MKKYAVTGGIASGKSTFCELIKAKKLPFIDCDALVHKAYEPEGLIYKAVLEHFGSIYLEDSGQINRKLLGKEIFNNPKSRAKLDQITHPIIRHLVEAELTTYKLSGEALVFVDVPLLFESGLQEDYDGTILIDIDEDLQVERLMARNHFTFEEAVARIQAQMPLALKRNLADYVLKNNATLERFQELGTELIEKLLKEKA